MTDTSRLKLFISYSHLDEDHIVRFTKHISPLKTKGLIQEWYDRRIAPGDELQNVIDSNLQAADVICLFISANFLSSSACLKEQAQALELRQRKGVVVVPVILSPCGWLDDIAISPLMALPSDGKPIISFADNDTAWHIVYEGIKRVLEELIAIKKLEINDEFFTFLRDTELLSKSHSQKSTLHLDDIFIWPELAKYDDLKDYEKTIKSENLLNEYGDCPKILIAGENQSGKTTLCKMLFIELRKKNFVPVYVSDKSGKFAGKIDNRIAKAFNAQYQGVTFEKIDKSRLVPIIDDFHFAAKRQEHIVALAAYCNQIVVVDDIFCLNFEDEQITKSFSHFGIAQLKPSYRNQLVKKWASLSSRTTGTSQADDNDMFQSIDATTGSSLFRVGNGMTGVIPLPGDF